MPSGRGRGLEPIGSDADPFTATFEGGWHVVSNLFIDRSTQDGVGLFGRVGEDGSIRRFGVSDVSVTGNDGVGGLVGRNHGQVESRSPWTMLPKSDNAP